MFGEVSAFCLDRKCLSNLLPRHVPRSPCRPCTHTSPGGMLHERGHKFLFKCNVYRALSTARVSTTPACRKRPARTLPRHIARLRRACPTARQTGSAVPRQVWVGRGRRTSACPAARARKRTRPCPVGGSRGCGLRTSIHRARRASRCCHGRRASGRRQGEQLTRRNYEDSPRGALL